MNSSANVIGVLEIVIYCFENVISV